MTGATNERVSCQALQVFYDYAEARGHSRLTLQEALPHSPAYLDRGGNWVAYETMLEMERRLALMFPDDDELFFKVGYSIGESRSLGFLRTITRAVISPFSVYKRIPGLMRRFLFRFFEARYEQVSWNMLQGHYRFEEDCPPSEAFLETARGVLTSVPLFVGAPPAEVTMRRIGPLELIVEVRVHQWRGLWASLAGFRQRRIESQKDAVYDLEEANKQLQDKIAALTEAKQEVEALRDSLAQRVEERTAELRVSQSQLEDTVSRLEQAHRAKNDFFANVSHELKTPPTMIMAPIDEAAMLFARQPDHKALPLLREARTSADRLLHLVSELLDVAAVDAHGMPPQIEPFDLGDLVRATCAELEPLARRKNLAWSVDTAGGPHPIRADNKLLGRAVLNLVVNAIKYTREGDSVAVRISDADESWRIEVRDTGPGIDASEHRVVFERFKRGSSPASTAAGGSGIGLALVRDIVRLHGGTIDLQSGAGEGCTFTILLPKSAAIPTEAAPRVAAKAPAAANQAVSVTAAASRDEEAPPTQLFLENAAHRVLVVEDDPRLRNFLVRLLSADYGVLAAADGAEGLAIARQQLPDLVLTDVMMPRMNGYELCSALKSDVQTRNIPVILITAKHGPKAAVEGFEARADDFVSKPFSTRELLARVQTQLRVRSLTTTLIRAEKQNMLGLLSAGIAHELLNPINAVVNAVPHVRQYLDAKEAGEQPRLDAETCGQLLDAIEQAGQRISGTVRTVLLFTRSEDGPPRMQIARLSEGIESMLLILQFKLRNVQVERDYGFDEEILCQPELVNQAVANLVVNAVDALPDNKGTIWISVRRKANRVEVRVRDDGPGVPAELRERIFAPFFTTKDPGAGTGLGLTIGREIVSVHGGSLELVPTDTGAEFVVSLPIGEQRQAGHDAA